MTFRVINAVVGVALTGLIYLALALFARRVATNVPMAIVGLTIYALLRRFRPPREVVELPQFTAEVVEVTGRAITRVRLRAIPRTDDEEEDAINAGYATVAFSTRDATRQLVLMDNLLPAPGGAVQAALNNALGQGLSC